MHVAFQATAVQPAPSRRRDHWRINTVELVEPEPGCDGNLATNAGEGHHPAAMIAADIQWQMGAGAEKRRSPCTQPQPDLQQVQFDGARPPIADE